MIVEVFFPVVERYFFAGCDTLLRPNPYPVAGDEGFRIGRTRVVDVAGGVAARAAVNNPLGINPKKVLPGTSFLYFIVRDERAGVLDDPLTGLNVVQCEQA